jgi:hypothetical protein
MLTSAVFILPAAWRDAGNALGENMGWGQNSYSVPLSPTGAEPPTHWGCRADLSSGFFDLLADPPAEAAPIIAELTLDTRETADPYSHWTDVLGAMGLQVVTEEI